MANKIIRMKLDFETGATKFYQMKGDTVVSVIDFKGGLSGKKVHIDWDSSYTGEKDLKLLIVPKIGEVTVNQVFTAMLERNLPKADFNCVHQTKKDRVFTPENAFSMNLCIKGKDSKWIRFEGMESLKFEDIKNITNIERLSLKYKGNELTPLGNFSYYRCNVRGTICYFRVCTPVPCVSEQSIDVMDLYKDCMKYSSNLLEFIKVDVATCKDLSVRGLLERINYLGVSKTDDILPVLDAMKERFNVIKEENHSSYETKCEDYDKSSKEYFKLKEKRKRYDNFRAINNNFSSFPNLALRQYTSTIHNYEPKKNSLVASHKNFIESVGKVYDEFIKLCNTKGCTDNFISNIGDSVKDTLDIIADVDKVLKYKVDVKQIDLPSARTLFARIKLVSNKVDKLVPDYCDYLRYMEALSFKTEHSTIKELDKVKKMLKDNTCSDVEVYKLAGKLLDATIKNLRHVFIGLFSTLPAAYKLDSLNLKDSVLHTTLGRLIADDLKKNSAGVKRKINKCRKTYYSDRYRVDKYGMQANIGTSGSLLIDKVAPLLKSIIEEVEKNF